MQSKCGRGLGEPSSADAKEAESSESPPLEVLRFFVRFVEAIVLVRLLDGPELSVPDDEDLELEEPEPLPLLDVPV